MKLQQAFFNGFGFVAIAFVIGTSVRADEPQNVNAQTESAEGVAYFETHIRPLLIKRCYSCHSSQAKKREGGLLLDTRTAWTTGGDNGRALVPGDIEASLLIKAVRYDDPDFQMPPGKKLDSIQIARLEHWVRIGAPDPRDGSATSQPVSKPSDPVAGRTHWAFRPLTPPTVPTVHATDWPRSDIDAFILNRLEVAGLRPAEDADRRTLARRVYFQLIGIPPTPAQVEEFVSDNGADAYERLVDKLLDSTHFGERWGRHWLDLARYADSNGLDENFLFREAWRYRNWVIDAVNSDMPFDQFLLEQIAGDLLPSDSIAQRDRQRVAAGFMVIGPKVLLGNKAQNQRMEVADEQLDTIGRAVLGQTIGCARCHDHKFDPIPTSDYYALAGILTSTQVVQQRYMLGQQRVMERLVGLGANGDTLNAAYEKYWRESAALKERVKQSKAALKLLEKDDNKAIQEIAKTHAAAVAENAKDESQPKADRISAQKTLISKLVAAATPPPIPPRAMIPSDADKPGDESIRLAGQFDRPGKKVARGFLQVVGDSVPQIPKKQSGRIELARWLTNSKNGAGHLTARVLANRIWHHLTGRGVVRTVDNFGRTGEEPSHPELLDYLAYQLIESGWSSKDIVRRVVLSRTFTMSSQHNDAAVQIDPENRLLWRANRRRLDPESLRDAMLAVAGTLDLTPLDSTVSYLGDQATAVGANTNRRRTDFPNRSVYLPVIRNDLPELFDVFDFADPHATTGARPQTMVATQGLYLLNDNAVMAAAEATAKRILSKESVDQTVLVQLAFELILNRRATNDDTNDILSFIEETRQNLAETADTNAEVRAWSIACHALFASSRFQMLE